MHGLVLNGSKNVFEVECEDGITRDCSIKGKVLKQDRDYYNPIAPGDIVELNEETLEEKKGQIIGIQERRNEFVRWNVKKKLPQLMACNLDYILIVTTPDEPPFRPRFIDRALAQAENQNIMPVIICNKYDLSAARNEEVQERLNNWEEIGYKVIRLSAKTGEGMVDLASLMENKLCALVGQSGVGKSSIINVLDNDVVLKTGSLSQKYGRGTHTTTMGALMHIQIDEALLGGIVGATADIIDTPGVRRFMLHGIKECDLALYYKDFKPYLGKCEYGMSCSHIAESGCAIKKAIEDGKISPLRYESWKRTVQEMKDGTWED